VSRHERRAAEARLKTPARLIANREQLATMVVRFEQAGQRGMAELLRHVSAGRIALVGLDARNRDFPVDKIRPHVPTVCVIGDDDYASTGPAGWLSAAAVAGWARSAIIHAAGDTAENYREAVYGAVQCGTCALIETDTANAAEWAALFPDRPRLLVWPREGLHPILPQREAVQ
jgi:hypothetical protein